MKHLLYKTIILTGLSLFGFCGSAAATTFIDGLEDVPLMKGMTQIQKDTISFGNEESRFVEAYLTSTRVGFKAVESFYTKTLPQLGWTYQGKRGNTLIFYRDSEMIEIVKETALPLEVRITVKSKM
ncbi:MAG: hypothetical protein OSJ76_02900 [Alphaproteobacteria bacterium]|nr:hypothetical protein [Alphaproteobacteria bacterium]